MAKRSKRKQTHSREIPAKATDPDIAATPPSSSVQRDWLAGLILVLAVVLAYSPVWWAGYICRKRGQERGDLEFRSESDHEASFIHLYSDYC